MYLILIQQKIPRIATSADEGYDSTTYVASATADVVCAITMTLGAVPVWLDFTDKTK